MAEHPAENPAPKPVKRERSVDRDSMVMTPEMKYKIVKSELMSPADRQDECRRDARLYEMDRERRKVRYVQVSAGNENIQIFVMKNEA